MIAIWLLNMPVYETAFVLLCKSIFEVIRDINLVKLSFARVMKTYLLPTIPIQSQLDSL